jgi:hypothetical protein
MSYHFCNETEPVFDHSTQWVGKADENMHFLAVLSNYTHKLEKMLIYYSPLYQKTEISTEVTISAHTFPISSFTLQSSSKWTI